MTLLEWTLLFAAGSLLCLWVVRGGGAVWMEGWRATLFIDWVGAHAWSAGQIRLYMLVLWLAHALWFVLGLFLPAARFV